MTSVHETAAVGPNDTIAAVATPAGPGGIGIIRLSGPRAHQIALRVFLPKNPPARWQGQRLYLGHILDPSTHERVDEVLVSFMYAPRSYTREDYAEINSHGGHVVLAKILQIILDAGARLANPGEFTLRAYLNGRIDLTQAEAVMDCINARSDRGLVLASRQMDGALKSEIESLRGTALSILAEVEAVIDFPDEEGVALEGRVTAQRIQRELVEPLEGLLRAHDRRRVWVEGVGTAIIGRVNAGKSSLLNRIVDEERAIVTPQAGTTRDVIETLLNLDGLPLRLMDTAGFRRARNEVEKIGLERSRRKLDEADLVLLVIDQNRPLGTDDLQLLERCRDKKSLVVLNKIDLPAGMGRGDQAHLEGLQTVRVSALTGEGMEELRRAIRDTLLSGDDTASFSGIAPNIRHREALQKACEAFRRSLRGVALEDPGEIVALELQSGLDALGEIVGVIVYDDLLEEIFGRFCIGK